MDIDIQTIIQQDIDLGVKKINYEYEFASAAGPQSAASSMTDGGFDFFSKYFDETGVGAAKGAGEFNQSDFLFKSTQHESERLKVTNLLY